MSLSKPDLKGIILTAGCVYLQGILAIFFSWEEKWPQKGAKGSNLATDSTD
jgi:hypothetical protein